MPPAHVSCWAACCNRAGLFTGMGNSRSQGQPTPHLSARPVFIERRWLEKGKTHPMFSRNTAICTALRPTRPKQ